MIRDFDPKKYIGKPWLKGGRDIDNGVDCWGLFESIYRIEFNIDLEEQYHYLPGETRKISNAFKNAIESKRWGKIDAPDTGCAVALSMGKKIHHVGIWVKDGCLHAVEGCGVVYNTIQHLKVNGYSRIEFYKWQKNQQ